MYAARLSLQSITLLSLTTRGRSLKEIVTKASAVQTMSHSTVARPSTWNVASWNVAAINNNPFEYWVTYDDADYNQLMESVQNFVNHPGDDDVEVNSVFTDDMFAQLKDHMLAQNWEGVDEVELHWKTELRQRRVVSTVLKDGELGAKRLMSMPDRITNTIHTADGSKAFRPTAINCYPGMFHGYQDWWSKWQKFMFETPLQLPGRSEGQTVNHPNAASMLVPIKRSKYPAITESEEKISIPLQTLYAAVFDAILIHMLERVASGSDGSKSWQELRKELVLALNSRKSERTIEIISNQYKDEDILFVQEAAEAFARLARSQETISEKFALFEPASATGRDQNSLIFLDRLKFNLDSVEDVTEQVTALLDSPSFVSKGDLLVLSVQSTSGDKFLLSSFHGDTNGLATIPVVSSVHKFASESLEHSHKLIFGLDANTYEHGKAGKKQDVVEFGKWFTAQGLNSCWGEEPSRTEYTTHNARTFLQPQLNKACAKEEARVKGDVNPKDFVLFYSNEFTFLRTMKDNTGERKYIDNMVFPTLTFPSDHAILSTTLQETQSTECKM